MQSIKFKLPRNHFLQLFSGGIMKHHDHALSNAKDAQSLADEFTSKEGFSKKIELL